MKTKTNILVALAGLMAVVLIIIAIVAHAPSTNCSNPDFANYISAYTEGAISKGGTIKVVINSSLADSIGLNKMNPEKLLKIYPNVKGKVSFADERTIEFAPEGHLESGKKYTVELLLKNICKVPGDLKRFVFPVSVIAQDLKVNIDDQITTDRQTLKYQQVSGFIKTADVESIENVKASVRAMVDSKRINIKWRETELGDIFNFTIDSIERIDRARSLVIKYNGHPMRAKQEGEKKLSIPAINEFAVNSIKVLNSPSQHIKIQFSDPVKENQDLDGLITVVGNSDCKYSLEIADNCVNIYPKEQQSGDAKVYVAAGIQNILGYKIAADKEFYINYEMQRPELRSVKTGLILPNGEDGLVYPFEAINLTAVDVTIIKVLEKNILSYIRDYSDYYNGSNLQQTGVPVFRKTIHINDRESEDVSQWKRYYLELSKLIDAEPGSIYNIKIAFRKSHAIFDCDSCNGGDDISMERDININDFDNYDGYYESLDNDYYESAGYDWTHRENPCYKMYYQRNRFLDQNILASNLGIIAKKGANESLNVFVTDLKNTLPVMDAKVELYGYQQQLIASKTTDKDGKADFGIQPKGYFVVAKRDKECNYLKIMDGNSLSLSKFNITGNRVQNGLKGYIYGERGVWRPGDSIHVSFILNEDMKNPLPDDYPISMEVRNPLGQQVFKETVTKNRNNFYVFHLNTSPDAVTGDYEATVSCGNARFSKKLHVENVLPNRLKINTKFNKETFNENRNSIAIESAWLHGSPARNLKASVEMMLTPATLSFNNWKDYSFSNERNSSFYSSWENVFEGNLDENGKLEFHQSFDGQAKDYPNKMTAHYRMRVFEKGGRFSRDEAAIDVLPYKYYIGIKMPDTDGRFLEVDKPQNIDFVICNPDGSAVAGSRNLKVKLYKLEWQWWYDHNNYVSEYNTTLMSEETIAINGTAQYKMLVKYPQWGRFMIEATDIQTGISSSKIFYMDWPDTFGRSPMLSQGSTIVEITSDKDKYTVGDVAKISIPSSAGGHALISIENGTQVINSQWITTKDGFTEYQIKIEPNMEPGVYVFASVIQPHAQTVNDMPIRMYGVLPLDIENPSTRITPVINMPDVIEAEQEVKISVSEKDNKHMTYTIALVDDGLLDLTHFQTPDPWKEFYSREALGVKTIDMYDNVIGAFGGKIEKMFSIGGDSDSKSGRAAKANNFESVVAFLGPFTLNGGKHTHTIKMPKYIGSVRTMVVAGNERAYGKAEKTSKVTKPLMIFATTPRIIGTHEKFNLPITLFAGQDNIKNVQVKIKATGGLKVNGNPQQQITFSGKGEQNPTFEIESGNDTGIGTIHISAISGNHTSEMDLKLQIREPNTMHQQVISKAVKAGESISIAVNPIGRPGTNTISMGVNGLLPINFETHAANLASYPYESLELTVCKAFPLIYAPTLTDISGQTKEQNENLIRESIKKIYEYQTPFGGLSYWKGENYTNVWLTSLAGNFVLEAKKAGYGISPEFIDKWKKFQRLKAESWTPDTRISYEEQAYRLYTLALAGEAQNGQMNRLKEMADITNEAKVYLAAAYALSGKKNVAEAIMAPLGNTFQSSKAMKLIAFCNLNQQDRAFLEAKEISDELSTNIYWINCETECMDLVAMGKYFQKYNPASSIKCEYQWNAADPETIESSQVYASKTLPCNEAEKKNTLKFTNKSEGNLYVEIRNEGIPEPGNEKAENSTIEASVKFVQGGREISPKSLKQGTDFTAIITIKNHGDQYLNKLAITEMFPSGWEILSGASLYDDNDNSSYDYDYYSQSGTIKYTDIRDDRKFTYFTLPAKGKMEFKTTLTATYAGEYYLPGISCVDLENPRVFAKTKGTIVKVEQDK